MKSSFVRILDVCRRKNGMPAYGKLLCTHQEKITWKYEPCSEVNCILFVVVSIAKRIVMDLLTLAQRRPRLKIPPRRTDSGKSVDSYWGIKKATYLLFVLQRVRFLQLRKEKKYNILYQCGYDDVTLEDILSISECDDFALLPYWIIIPHLSRKQLLFLTTDLFIKLPPKCPKTRQSLIDAVMNIYTTWENVLLDRNTSIDGLLSTFSKLVPFSCKVHKAKKEIWKKIQLIKPDDECMINWITTNTTSFCPIIKQAPGPPTHRLLVTSWLHKCQLLHEANKIDTRQTRVLSDNDCRTTCLHLRTDCGEDTLTLCKQMGWKVPPACADTGSAVYRRCEAVVTSNEYNSRLISWLQILCEGRLVVKAGID